MKEGWQYLQFEDALQKVKYTKKVQSSDYLHEGRVPIVSQEEEIISGYWNNSEDAFKVETPIVVFGDHSRVVKYINYDFVLGADGVKILKPIKELDARFLYFFLKWYDVPSLGYSRHYKLLKEIVLPIPPLSEQQHIVEELDLLSSIIEKKKEQLKELDNLPQSIFYDMFGDPVVNEKGWPTKTLGELSEKIANGYNAKLEEDTYKSEGIMYFRCQNVWRNRFDYSDLVYIDEETNKKMKSSSLKHNDFLVTKIGRVNTENSSLGRISLYEGDDDKANLSGNLCFIRLKKDVLVHKYLLYIFVSDQFRDYIRRTTVGGIDKRALNTKQLSTFPVHIPPLSLQQQFAEKIEAIEKQKEQIKQSIAEVETLFNSRMDYYFT